MQAVRLCVAIICALAAQALDNGLGLTPQRGYNSWYHVFMMPSEASVLATAAALQATGLKELGYVYVNLDDGIVASRAPNGTLIADPKFTHGMPYLSGMLHSQGFLFGVYTDRGPLTCGGRPASGGYEAVDATTYKAWGVDYVKEDSCNAAQDHATAFKEYAAMRDALNATGRPMLFSLCGWEPWYSPVGAALGNSFRIGPDDTNWAGVLANIDIMSAVASFAGAGAINDPCLLLGADSSGKEAVTEAQSRAQFSMWTLMRAPLLLSQTIANMSAHRLETYSNVEGIRLKGGPLAPAGTPMHGTYRNPLTRAEFAAAPAPMRQGADPAIVMQPCGSPAAANQVWKWNVSAPNFLSNPVTGMCLNLDDCGTNLIAYSCVTTGGTCCGASCYNNEIWSISALDGSFRSALDPSSAVTDPGSGGRLGLAPFSGSPAQRFAYDAATSTIRGGAAAGAGENCATISSGAGANVTNVWGRQMANGDWAFVMLNAGSAAANISCTLADGCLGPTGWEAGQALKVRDLWAHTQVGNTTAAAGIAAMNLAPEGGVAVFRVTPMFEFPVSAD